MQRKLKLAGALILVGIMVGSCDRTSLQIVADVVEDHQLVVVSLGDSFVSGEGNPDVPKTAVSAAQWNENPAYAPGFCHRSAVSAHRLAFARVTDAWTKSDEEIYANFACSGSSTRFGLRFSRRGSAAICSTSSSGFPPPPYCGQSQIQAAKAWAEDPENGIMRIDVVMLSI